MKKIMFLILVLSGISSIADTPEKCLNGPISSSSLAINFNCIQDWNPCDLNWWKNQKDDNEQMKWAVPMFPRNVGLGASIAPVQ